ncbi:MAG: DUF4150 domain-containing protein [Gammaproteobacteria bacterium]|nr:DUF4150 domain-containing protein [Gammaproteobacteria bacterium]
MFANCQMGGMNLGVPDVCLTPIPTPVGPVPTPIPYPNMAMGMTAIPNQFKVLLMAGPAHNLMTTVPMSNGDNAGVNMGVASGMMMGPSRHTLGSTNVLFGGMPATKMTSMTMQNSTNAPGLTLVPSQFKVMLLR